MREWLDLHIGTDWATYQGWILGIASLGLTIWTYSSSTYNKTKNK